jgi:cell division protein FtsL|tara:strand:+ start:74 stop:376 length:303 start_codon:yes stop_codon:yes gene_type:complete
MKKFFVFMLIFSLIVVTSLIKNSTKKVDDEIYSLNENIRFLENRLKDTKLEHDYLSSSEKLLEYQKLYFENSLQKKSIDEINTIKILNNKLLINKLKMSD